ncbi:ARCA-like protein [Fusarium subglutinans]|uniref:ARCA-like protein n=1 Tax=Gibberella subglutinans TaxID=42677 RepID=A0A8H5Q3I2_GIBSU|nr:ARCA-like protein [Fusarium subglutinans]KAF5606923.1 ARCA-like protein [Fusarium subglutinans]
MSESLSTRPLNPCIGCRVKICKQRHLKCDNDKPSCANCRKSDIECVRGFSVRFRHGLNPSIRSGKAVEAKNRDYSFSQDQPWVKTTRALSFVDETPDIINIHDSNNLDTLENFDIGRDIIDRASNQSSPPLASLQTIRSNDSASYSYQDRPSKKRALSPSSSGNWKNPSRSPSQKSDTVGPFSSFSGPHTIESPPILGSDIVLDVGSPQVAAALASSRGTDIPLPVDNVAEAISGIYLDTPRWPLEDPQEAMLFYNFIHVLAPLFDLCDSERHFATIVPRRAVICPPLMNAVLAASAKRLSRIDGFDGLVGDRYHQNCLDALIPALSSSAAVMDENLLTAIVILRYMEELDVPLTSADTASESHLVGTRVFVAAQEKVLDFTGLRRAAFWVALRQEIHMAFMQARPVHPNFALEDISRLVQDDDTCCTFANLTILQCAACLRYCYGSEDQSFSAWERLQEAQERWWADRPWHFHPMYINTDAPGIFPQALYLNDAVVTGVLHYLLIQVLLAAHNPRTPKLGPGQAKAAKSTNEEIRKTVKMVCGVAESNQRNPTGYAKPYMACYRKQMYNLGGRIDQSIADKSI